MLASRRIFRHSFLFAIFILLPSSLLAQGPAEATAEFAEKIVRVAGANRKILLPVGNHTSMGTAEFDRLSNLLAYELQKRGLRTDWRDADFWVEVTLSENIRGYLWVARIRLEGKEEVVMVPFPRPVESSAAPAEPLRIEKKLILQQAAPILDVGFFEDAQGQVTAIAVLEGEKVSLYSAAESGWRLRATLPIASLRAPLPRDPRGKIEVEGSEFRVAMDRVECSGTAAEPPLLDCLARENGAGTFLHASRAQTLNVNFVPGRNFFKLNAEEAKELPGVSLFYSLAALETFNKDDETDWWIVAATDGHTRLLREDGSVAAELSGWGSHVAGIASYCGASRQVLGTRGGDSTEPDAVQAFEIRDGQAVAVSASAELPGPVTALWATESGAEATAVVYNLKSKNYEAYTLSFVCRH